MHNILTHTHPSQQEVTQTSQETPLESSIKSSRSLRDLLSTVMNKASTPKQSILTPTSQKRHPFKQWRHKDNKFMPKGYIVNDLESFVDGLRGYRFEVFKWLMKFVDKSDIYFSQDKFARKIGCSRETVNKILAEFASLGLIDIYTRKVNFTCYYRISNFFKNDSVKSRLTRFIKYFSFIPLALLLSSSRNIESKRENVFTQYKNEIYNNIILEEEKRTVNSTAVVTTDKPPHKIPSSRGINTQKGNKYMSWYEKEMTQEVEENTKTNLQAGKRLACGAPVDGGAAARAQFLRENFKHSSNICPHCREYRYSSLKTKG